MKQILFFVFFLSVVLSINAQNSSPFWSLAGNSNATSTSKLGTTNSINLRLFTNNAERMRITPGGNAGIGTTSPLTKLHVNGFGSFGNRVSTANATRALNLIDDNAVMRVLRVDPKNAPAVELISRTSADGVNVAYWDFYAQPSDASFRIRDRQSGGSGIDRVTISHTTGYVGIGTSTPAYRLHVKSKGTAIYGNSTGGGYNDTTYGVYGNSGFAGVYGKGGNTGIYGDGGENGVYGNGGENGVYGDGYTGVWGQGHTGVIGYGTSVGVYGNALNGLIGEGVFEGVVGHSSIGDGVYGYSDSSYGVSGSGSSSYGGYFTSTNNYGIVARTDNAHYAGVFYGHVYSSAGFVTSDKNLKKDIKEFGDAMSIINKLKPQNYLFKDDAKYASLHLPKGRHYGLLAQDLEQVLPNLVSEAPHELTNITKPVVAIKPTINGKPQPVISETKAPKETINIKAVNYLELIPIMVKAMQEQQNKMQQLNVDKDKQVADLQAQINELKALILKNGNSSTTTSADGYLKQNTPNPASSNTVIHYYTADNTKIAQLLVSDMKGSVLKAFTLAKGEGQVNIRSGELLTGTYNYTLYVNNSKIDTKQMIVVK